jgi:tol-pal system protein YbgF
MKRAHLNIAWPLLLGLLAGCAGSRLEARLELLEQGLADQRQVTKRLETRLDELQIQLRLLRRGRTRGAAGDQPRDLAVVKLRPEPEPPAQRQRGPEQAAAAEPERGWRLKRTELEEIDPAEVTERLPVDRATADRALADEQARHEQRQRERAAELAAEFQQAFTLYRQNRLERASDALRDFARRNPGHTLAPDALFYAGKSRLQLGQVQRAERAFLELARRFPDRERSAEALLMAGRCQERQGQTKRARATYLQLVDAYPLSEQATEANKRLESIR